MSNVIDFFTFEDDETYHSRSKSGEVLSSHMLLDFKSSPKFYHKKITGAITEKPRSAFTFGRACHKLILEGKEAFDKEYIVSDGPVNEKTGVPFGSNTKAYLEWKYAQTKEIISISDYGEIAKMNLGVQNNEIAKELLSSGVAEAVVRFNYFGMPCQIKIDWFNPDEGIVDLKSTAELKYFENDSWKYHYVEQMAFYQAGLEILLGESYPVHLLAIEKQEPYSAGVWKITQEALDRAKKSNEKAIVELLKCKETNAFPTGYEKLRFLS